MCRLGAGSSPDPCESVSHLAFTGRAPVSFIGGGGAADTFSILPLVDQNVMIYDSGVCKTKAEESARAVNGKHEHSVL